MTFHDRLETYANAKYLWVQNNQLHCGEHLSRFRRLQSCFQGTGKALVRFLHKNIRLLNQTDIASLDQLLRRKRVTRKEKVVVKDLVNGISRGSKWCNLQAEMHYYIFKLALQNKPIKSRILFLSRNQTIASYEGRVLGQLFREIALECINEGLQPSWLLPNLTFDQFISCKHFSKRQVTHLNLDGYAINHNQIKKLRYFRQLTSLSIRVRTIGKTSKHFLEKERILFVRSAKYIPKSVKKLEIRGAQIQAPNFFQHFKCDLTHLALVGCRVDVPSLMQCIPRTVTHLALVDFVEYDEVCGFIPDHIQYLNLTNSLWLSSDMFTMLPSNLKFLDLSFTEFHPSELIVTLPESLQVLKLNQCRELDLFRVTKVPATLIKFDCYGCGEDFVRSVREVNKVAPWFKLNGEVKKKGLA